MKKVRCTEEQMVAILREADKPPFCCGATGGLPGLQRAAYRRRQIDDSIDAQDIGHAVRIGQDVDALRGIRRMRRSAKFDSLLESPVDIRRDRFMKAIMWSKDRFPSMSTTKLDCLRHASSPAVRPELPMVTPNGASTRV